MEPPCAARRADQAVHVCSLATLPVHTAAAPQLPFIPTAAERAVDACDLQMIRDLYGSRSQTIINTLTCWDAFFDWYYALELDNLPVDASMSERETRALDNMQKAIVMHEAIERTTIHQCKSFLPHGCVFKISRDILTVADLHAYNTSPLELQNAKTKRTAKAGGSRRLETTSSGHGRLKDGTVVKTKGYSSSMALSTLNKLLVSKYLQRGDGIIATPACRRKERLFGKNAGGRLTLEWRGVKEEGAYEPREDSCVKAFIRLIAAAADAEASS